MVNNRQLAMNYLKRAYSLKCDIERKQNQVLELRALAERATGTWQALRVSGTSDNSKLERAVIKMADLEIGLERDVTAFMAAYREIEGVIEALSDPRHRQLLSLRYLSFMKWWEIAEVMDKSEYHVTHYIHPNALGSVATIIAKARD